MRLLLFGQSTTSRGWDCPPEGIPLVAPRPDSDPGIAVARGSAKQPISFDEVGRPALPESTVRPYAQRQISKHFREDSVLVVEKDPSRNLRRSAISVAELMM